MKQTLLYEDGKWWIELDSAEIYPDDPGEGTPAMLYFDPRGQVKVPRASVTFDCALHEGEIFAGDCVRSIPAPVLEWLDNVAEQVEGWLDSHSPGKAAAPAPGPAGPR